MKKFFKNNKVQAGLLMAPLAVCMTIAAPLYVLAFGIMISFAVGAVWLFVQIDNQ
jgi:hypothetical protein